MKKLAKIRMAGIGLFLCFSSMAQAVPMFARMYSYNCTTCHYPGYGQLNKFGFNFRAAGYRIPADIGKDMNDGKFDVTNYVAFRYSAGISGTTTSNKSGAPQPDNGSFTLGGASLYLGGGISKNFFLFSELGLGDGSGVFPNSSPSLSSAKMGYVNGKEDEFYTVRLGKFQGDGFGGSDRGPVGIASISSYVRPTGTGLELGYTHQDTRVTLGFFNGIQNDQYTGLDKTSNGAANTTSSLTSPASDSNNAKDIQLIVNQFIGDDGLAVNAIFYNGYNASVAPNGVAYAATGANIGGTGDSTGQEYRNAALFISSPVVKNLDIKVGGELGRTGTGIFTQSNAIAGPSTGGFFGELDYTLDDLTPVAFRYDYTDANSLSALNTDTQKFTFGALTPFVQNIYQNPQASMTTQYATAGAAASFQTIYKFTDSLNLFF